ncbi:MAG: glycosyltransferase [Candidatus Jordarchaeum sp.]|uniref:glycosyltransferase n=1 Tax=Candidatus Jordarchaeum sp. TaxID=2823881 RepID=UPI00404B09BB
MFYLENYRDIVGEGVLSTIHRLASKLYGRHIVFINSTFQGGGVPEVLKSLIPLMNDVGLDAGWRILHGTPDFFTIVRKFRDALQGENIHFTEIKRNLYVQANEDFSVYTHIDHDCVIIHETHPLPLIKFYKKRQPWIWRCHLDISNPNRNLFEFLKNFILRYDAVIFSCDRYKKEDLPVEQRIMQPGIDPLSPKNKELSEKDVLKYLKKFDVPRDKPVITQISSFDKWRDPEGVIEVFKLVKQKVDCRLVLCGSMERDYPGAEDIVGRIREREKKLIENQDIILINTENNIVINSLQRSSDVIIQKSLKEGFGLTVTEALWKEKPIVASTAGCIPLQIRDGENGFLVDPDDIKGFTTVERFNDK